MDSSQARQSQEPKSASVSRNRWISKSGRGIRWLVPAGILAVAGIWKAGLLAANAFPFNADEAVVALMARHILQGERPIFFYGQAYMGSLDAYLVAGGFWLFGQQVWVIRAVQILLYLLSLAIVNRLGRDLFHSDLAGWIAMALLALPAVNTTLYTTISLGGYGEAFLLQVGLLWLGFRIAIRGQRGEKPSLAAWLAFGFLSGLGLWAFGLSLLATAACILYWYILLLQKRIHLERRLLPGLGIALVGFLVGATPWLVYALQNGAGRLFAELTGSAVAIEQTGWLAQIGQHAVNYLLFGLTAWFGLRPPWEVRWLAVPLIPLILAFWGWTGVLAVKRLRARDPGALLLVCLVGVHFLAFVLTSFGVDPSGRYFLPMAVPAALLAGAGYPQFRTVLKRWTWALYGLVILFQVAGTLQCALVNPPGLTTQFAPDGRVDQRQIGDLVDFLQDQGETRGYTDYWVSYPLAFLSDEKLIFTPRLPYHTDLRYTARDDRYPPYDRLVDDAQRVAFITTHQPLLEERLRQGFAAEGIAYQEIDIGAYHVFYHLSQKIAPDRLRIYE